MYILLYCISPDHLNRIYFIRRKYKFLYVVDKNYSIFWLEYAKIYVAHAERSHLQLIQRSKGANSFTGVQLLDACPCDFGTQAHISRRNSHESCLEGAGPISLSSVYGFAYFVDVIIIKWRYGIQAKTFEGTCIVVAATVCPLMEYCGTTSLLKIPFFLQWAHEFAKQWHGIWWCIGFRHFIEAKIWATWPIGI